MLRFELILKSPYRLNSIIIKQKLQCKNNKIFNLINLNKWKSIILNLFWLRNIIANCFGYFKNNWNSNYSLW